MPRFRTAPTGGRTGAAARSGGAGGTATSWSSSTTAAHPPRRWSRRTEALSRENAALCGTRSALFYDPAGDRAWRYDFGGRAGRFLVGTSLVYRRALWQRQPFDDMQVGEDVRFVSRAAGALVDLADPQLAVAIVHKENTSPKRTQGSYWRSVPVAAVHALLGDDLRFYRPAAAALDAGAPALISCIMPTRDRRAFVAHSLRLFAAQDYPHRELIVVDDGDDAVADLVEAAAGAR